ncbi:MAG: dicarboxylate/amino acid:cation symporter [Hyphomicrobiales bacterium]|nr:dicarboxylate/amino acid:cation symporter [Hyphomicrobiales bacterium]
MADDATAAVARKTGPFSFWTNLKLWQQILIALVAGLVVGAIWGPGAENIKPIGTVFISLIKMLIVPLVFSSLVVGVCSIEDTKKMGRIGAKSLGLYLITTAIAIAIGLIVGIVLQPGAGIDMAAAVAATPKESPGFIATLVGIVPKNPVGAMSSGNILQIIVFAVLLGIAMNLAGERAAPVKAVFESFAEIMYKLTHIVMLLAPYGVFALMAWVAGKYGMDVLLPLAKVIIGVYLACILHVLLVLTGGGIMLMGRLNPVRYLRGIIDAQAVAFTTTSSSGTLPVTISCARENLGVSKPVSSFVLPLGATINMDGTALYQGVAALFVAQAFGISLGAGDYVTIILTSTLASIGTAGVPGAGLIMLSLVLTSVGLPLEGLAIIAGIDRILDMARTTVNVTGDLMVSVLVGKSEGELDLETYNKVAVV